MGLREVRCKPRPFDRNGQFAEKGNKQTQKSNPERLIMGEIAKTGSTWERRKPTVFFKA